MSELKDIVLVVALGYYGRGSTIQEAAANCHKAGAGKRDKCVVIIADKPVRFVDALTIRYPEGRPSFQIAFPVKQLGALMP